MGGNTGGGWRRGGNCSRRSAVASATRRIARSSAGSVAGEGAWTPLTLRTYWRAAASISVGVAGGSRPRSVVMLRHMELDGTCSDPAGPRAPGGSCPFDSTHRREPSVAGPPALRQRGFLTEVEIISRTSVMFCGRKRHLFVTMCRLQDHKHQLSERASPRRLVPAGRHSAFPVCGQFTPLTQRGRDR